MRDNVASFLPQWSVGMRWLVQYEFEQRVESLAGAALTTLPENAEKKDELWLYEVFDHDRIGAKNFLVIKALPAMNAESGLQGSQFMFYFDEQSMTLHSFKRLEQPLIGDGAVDYVKNPWGLQSFFIHHHVHVIPDWPLLDEEEKEVGIGDLRFLQKHSVNDDGLTVAFAGDTSTTVLTWKQGRPWWVLADKIIKIPGRVMHIRARLIEQEKKKASPATVPPSVQESPEVSLPLTRNPMVQ